VVLVVVIVPLASDVNVRRLEAFKVPMTAMRQAGTDIPNVWAVEQTKESDIYSNGLQIENRLAVTN